MNAGRRLARAGIVLAALAGFAPPVSAGPDTVKGWVISRTSAAAQRLTATLTMTARNDHGTIVVVGLTGTGRHRAPVEGGFYSEVGIDAYPHVYDNGPIADCLAAELCTHPLGQSDTRTIDTETPVKATFYVAALDADVQISDLAAGWTVRTAQLSLRVVRGEQARATGARIARTPVEHFTHAELPGGPYGSVVAAVIPCDRGTGAARLVGAGKNLPLDCTTGPIGIGANTPSRTTWTLDGDVTGVGYNVNRLAVFDYPKA